MKIILGELSVWWFRSSCLLIGGIILLIVSASSGNRWLIRSKEIIPVGVCGFFNVGLWNLLSAYGVSLMPAGRASIIAFTMPLWAAIFAYFLLSEKINFSKIFGLVLGLSGMMVLIGADFDQINRAPIGAFFMLAAAISWGLGTILMKRGKWSIPVSSHVAWQLILSSIPVIIGAMVIEPFPNLTTLSTPAILALIYIFAFPMTFCQWAYMKAVNLLPATVASIGTLAVPIIGIYSSHIVLSEPVGVRELTALGLICGALVCVLVLPNLSRFR